VLVDRAGEVAFGAAWVADRWPLLNNGGVLDATVVVAICVDTGRAQGAIVGRDFLRMPSYPLVARGGA
jgi:hypothetical protein